MEICVIKKCFRAAVKTGFCSAHYKKRARGDYSIDVRLQPSIAGDIEKQIKRFSKRIKNGCLIWTGSKKNNGYGRITYNGKRWPTHRAVYQYCKGIIKNGNDIHHKCGNKLCVEISHLESLPKFLHTKTLKRNKKGQLMSYSQT